MLARPAHACATLRPGGQRLLLSDFLSGHDPTAAVRALSRGATQLGVVMLLGPWEAAPSEEGLRTLVDAESGETWTTEVDGDACARYRQRLLALKARVERATRAAAGSFAVAVCDTDLPTLLRRDLMPHGLVVPA